MIIPQQWYTTSMRECQRCKSQQQLNVPPERYRLTGFLPYDGIHLVESVTSTNKDGCILPSYLTSVIKCSPLEAQQSIYTLLSKCRESTTEV